MPLQLQMFTLIFNHTFILSLSKLKQTKQQIKKKKTSARIQMTFLEQFFHYFLAWSSFEEDFFCGGNFYASAMALNNNKKVKLQ